MVALEQQILRTDAAGMPLEWIDYREAVKLHFLGMIAYTCGRTLFSIRGGVNARSRRRSVVELNSILATHGQCRKPGFCDPDYVPPLNNAALFARDAWLCMYCGGHFDRRDLSRDHVTPLSQGGLDQWSNVITSCRRCNNYKAGRTPEQAGLELLAVPFVPTHAEYVFLKARHVLADQMEFLQAHFPRRSPLRGRRLIKTGDVPSQWC